MRPVEKLRRGSWSVSPHRAQPLLSSGIRRFVLGAPVTADGVVDPLFDPAVVEDPHSYWSQLRAADPVHEVPGTGTFLVTRMDLIHEVVAAPAVFSSRCAQFLHRSACEGGPG